MGKMIPQWGTVRMVARGNQISQSRSCWEEQR